MVKITDESIEEVAIQVEIDEKYGSENKIINGAMTKCPENTDKSIVAMKISLIDLTNGTNLIRNLGKKGGLNKLAEKITTVNFDERVKNGDLDLVEELSRWSKEEIGKNLFSFISKYCLYHNVHCYNRDDYVIYDSIMCENIPLYIDQKKYKESNGKRLTKNHLKNLKDEFNYHDYLNIINTIIIQNNIKVDKPHRKLDWFIWYPNR